MTQQQTLRRYSRIALAILATTNESDPAWAARILESKSQMSKGIVREAIKGRHTLGPSALRAVKRLLGSIENTTTMSQV